MLTSQINRVSQFARENFSILLASAFALLIFSSWYLLQYFTGNNEYFGVVVSPSSMFQSIYSWLPVVRSMSEGVLFPTLPTLSPDTTGLRFYPYLSLWFYSGIISFFGYKGILIIGQCILPTLSFFLIVKIFHRFLSLLWSVAIGFVSFISFTDWPFRQFLIGILQGKGWLELGVYQPLEILHFPIPSLSIFTFLLLFYISTRSVRLTWQRMTILSIAWALLSQIHIVDAVFGLTFWTTYFLIRLWRQQEKVKKIIFYALTQSLLIAIIIFPAIFSFLQPGYSGLSISNELGFIAGGLSKEIGIYYFVAYLFVPLLLMSIVYYVQRVDLFEIIVKFWHIYSLMFIEFIFISVTIFSSTGINLAVLQNRITLFFLHFYYYVPVIYYATKPAYAYYSGTESRSFSTELRRILYNLFARYQWIYLPLIIFLLLMFSITSAYKNFNFQQAIAEPELATAWNEFKTLQPYYLPQEVLVSEEPVINMIATIAPHTTLQSLWVNRFANYLPEDKIIIRLALYARIFNWPIEKFIAFMTPGKLQQSRGTIVDLTSKAVEYSGVGYWLVFHERNLSDAEKIVYEQRLRKYYALDINSALKEFNVKKIFAYHPLLPDISVKQKLRVGDGYLYYIF